MRYLCFMSNFAQNNMGKTNISLFPYGGGTVIPRKRNAILYALGHAPHYVACLRHAVDGPSPTLRMG